MRFFRRKPQPPDVKFTLLGMVTAPLTIPIGIIAAWLVGLLVGANWDMSSVRERGYRTDRRGTAAVVHMAENPQNIIPCGAGYFTFFIALWIWSGWETKRQRRRDIGA